MARVDLSNSRDGFKVLSMVDEDPRDVYRSALAWAEAEGICVYVLEDGRGQPATLNGLSEKPEGISALTVSYYKADGRVEVATTFERDRWTARMECEAHLAGDVARELVPGRPYFWTVRTGLRGRVYERARRAARSRDERLRPTDPEPYKQAHDAAREAILWRRATIRIDGEEFEADEARLAEHRMQLCMRPGLPTLRIHSHGWDGPLDIRAQSDLTSLYPPDLTW